MTLTDAFLTKSNKNALEVATPIHLKMLSDSYPVSVPLDWVSECTTWWVWGAKFTLNHYVFRKTVFSQVARRQYLHCDAWECTGNEMACLFNMQIYASCN